jgi:WD40 repeat-containing protein SMU1
MLNPTKVDELIVCPASNSVYSMTTAGKVMQTWSSGHAEESAHFVAAAVSPRGTYLYCLGGDGNVYCFNVKEGRLDHLLKAHGEGTPIGVVLHPHLNLLATFADEAELKCWRAA